ncbi:MAG: VWA domain-containing protein [Proteobacteria bacterium]|nr:VWA domain-containing protein [Pseudomonadota bacterium]
MSFISVTSRIHAFLSMALCLAFLFIVPGIGVRTCQSATAPSGNLVFILDASGSMGAQIQGKMKIDIAKEVLTGLIHDLPAGVNVGLVAYGHRQKADCNDVEELTTLGPLDRESLVSKIKALDHKGKTPITLSVQKVAEGLKTLEDETTIILVSDGEETCQGDPCAMVKDLKATGVKFMMHVIGFDVTDKEKAQLACMAEAGGGTYFTAKNVGELTSAAKKVVEKTEQSSGKLKVNALRNGKPIGAWYEVFKAEAEGSGEKLSVATNPINAGGEEIKLVPGTYDLIIKNQEDAGNPTMSFPGIAIEVGKTVTKVADFSGGTLKVKALRNGKPVGAWYEVFKAEEEGSEAKESVASNPIGDGGESVKLLPGVYDLTIRNQEDAGNPTMHYPGTLIEAGKTVEKVANFSGGALKIKALKNGKPIGGWYEIFKVDAKGTVEQESVASNPISEEGENVKLIPGAYELKITNQNDSGNSTKDFPGITIEAGKTVEKVAVF